MVYNSPPPLIRPLPPKASIYLIRGLSQKDHPSYKAPPNKIEFDGTMEKIWVNHSLTQEELRKYRKCSLFNDERETTRAIFWKAKTRRRIVFFYTLLNNKNTQFIVNKQYCTKKNMSWWVKFNDNATAENKKFRVNRSSTQEELWKYRKCDLFNNERETTRAKFWRAKTSMWYLPIYWVVFFDALNKWDILWNW
jgi:hypothetical protein